jgi:hypothetical protein
MKFIKSLTEGNFTQINGNYMSSILGELLSAKKVEPPSLVESEIVGLQ